MSSRDTALMARAFAEAQRAGWLTTAPNPRVGALALQGGHVVGHGHHVAFGEAHAEEMALRDAGAWDPAARQMRPGHVDEMIVTLEPCSAKGKGKKRPPCLEHLLQAGVQRVVVGAEDPDPRHQGAGLKRLEEAGLEVAHLGMEDEFGEQNPAFLAALEHPERPWILLKWAASVDGRTAAASGESQWITGTSAREEVHRLRSLSDGVLAGRHTVRKDRPRLTARDLEGKAEPSTARILVASLQDMSSDHPLLEDKVARYWVEGESTDADPPDWWDSRDTLCPVPQDPAGAIDLLAASRLLAAEHGFQRILVEGGARLQARILEAGLADAVVRYEAPLLLHGGLAALEGEGTAHPQAGFHLQHEERLDLGADLRRAFLIQAQP